MKVDWFNPMWFAGSMMYALAGVLLFWLCFLLIDKLTPYKLWEEIVEHRNVALAIVVASMCIAIGMIVSAAVHG
jgi:putative membrane protein